MAPTAASGPVGALKLPQRVRAKRGHQMFFGHMWTEHEVWGVLKLSQWVRAKPASQTAFFNLKIKSRAIAGLEVP
jgi:hypothetical protein